MLYRVRLGLLMAVGLCAQPASAADLPAVKMSGGNQIPACTTPGRLMAYLKSRNKQLDPKFDEVARLYKKHGEALGIRWDYAFYQMIVETNALSFKRGNGSWGDVKPSQNNFAGLGATGKGEPGETFPDVSTGVLGHLQHLLMYAGEHVPSPVADRTRKVQEWKVLASWHKTISGPVTFAQLTRKWSPGDRGYARDIDAVAKRFDDNFCNTPDPAPEMVVASAPVEKPAEKPVERRRFPVNSVEEPQDEKPIRTRSGLGAQEIARKVGEAVEGAPKRLTPETAPLANLKIINPSADEEPAKEPTADEEKVAPETKPQRGRRGRRTAEKTPPAKVEKIAASSVPRIEAPSERKVEGRSRKELGDEPKLAEPVKPAPLPNALEEQPTAKELPAKVAMKMPAPPAVIPPASKAPEKAEKIEPKEGKRVLPQTTVFVPAPPQKPAEPEKGDKEKGVCRVWTASYGGQKALIIKLVTDGIVNYTVLDVNEGTEDKEAQAYISAYARGGAVDGRYDSNGAAMDRAFELCPES